MALSTRLSISPGEPRFVAEDDRAARPAAGRRRAATPRSPPRGLPDRQQRLDQPAEVDRLEAGARQLGVEPRGLGDVDDQPVEPDDVAADDVEQLPAKRRILDPLEAVDRGAKRGERVLELVGDVGGEGLGGVDPLAQDLGHVVQRPGEQADLVAPGGQERHVDLAGAAEPDPVGGARQPAQRHGDGPRQEEREQDRDDERDRAG